MLCRVRRIQTYSELNSGAALPSHRYCFIRSLRGPQDGNEGKAGKASSYPACMSPNCAQGAAGWNWSICLSHRLWIQSPLFLLWNWWKKIKQTRKIKTFPYILEGISSCSEPSLTARIQYNSNPRTPTTGTFQAASPPPSLPPHDLREGSGCISVQAHEAAGEPVGACCLQRDFKESGLGCSLHLSCMIPFGFWNIYLRSLLFFLLTEWTDVTLLFKFAEVYVNVWVLLALK